MAMHPDEPRRRALAYLRGRSDIVDDLGSGTDGWVFSLKPYSVIKVHENRRRFYNELHAYQRLQADQVIEINGLSVPQLQGADEELLLVEMSYVQPPYLIDFGKCTIDTRPDFTDEALEMADAEVRDRFGPRADDAFHARDVLWRRHGIYYYDISRYNIDFGDDA